MLAVAKRPFLFSGKRFFASNNKSFVQVYTETPTKSSLTTPGENGSKSQVRVYYPKPDTEEAPKQIKTGWGGSKFLFFVFMQMVPIAGFLYAIKVSSDEISTDRALVLPKMPSEILDLADRGVKKASVVHCMYLDDGKIRTTSVSPCVPESRVYDIPEAQFISGVKNSGLTDIFAARKSDFSLPFNFVHFGVEIDSPFFKSLDNCRDVTLAYTSTEEGVIVELRGVAVKVQNLELKRHYWRERWGKYIEPKKYELIKVIPTEISVQHLSKTRLMNDWEGVKVVRYAPTPDRLEWASPSVVKA